MDKSVFISLMDESAGAGGERRNTVDVIGLELDIPGEPLHFRIGVADGPAKLADIVPLARAICTKITDVVIKKTQMNEEHIPCRQGCSACCRYIVPVSIPEAFRMREELLARPASQQKLMQRSCLLAARRILKRKPTKLLAKQATENQSNDIAGLKALADWYAALNVPCPFHCMGICTVYGQRPIACREHLVKGSARACSGRRGEAEVIDIPVQVGNALCLLSSRLENTCEEAVMLPLAFIWCDENLHRSEQTWSAKMMVEQFVDIIGVMAKEKSEAVAASA